MKAELDVNKTVKKSNILNELRNANASLVEYRLFCVYLAHLSLKSEDNVVTFSLADYARIAGLGRPRYDELVEQSKNMLKMTALVKQDDGGFINRNLFSEFQLFKDKEDGQWMVSLECSSKIAPLIREQKGRFLRYKLYNTIYLKSFNQQRIYELLKQYETIGVRLISLEDLRAFLGIGEGEYSVWGDFSQKVLKVAQKALRENTDICFEYEPIKKGRPVVAVKFTISKNQEFVDLMEMDKFLPEADTSEYEGEEIVVRVADEDEFGEQTSLFDDVAELKARGEICAGFDDKIFLEFSLEQLQELKELAWNNADDDEEERQYAILHNRLMARQYAVADYIRQKIRYCNAYPDPVPHRYRFIKKAVAEDWR